MTALVVALVALATLGAPPPLTPMRLYGHVLQDNTPLLPGAPSFDGTLVTATFAAPGGPLEVSRAVLGTGSRGEWYVLDIPLGDGVTAPRAGDTVALKVDGDPVVSAQPVALAAVQRVDLFHVPGASITVLPVAEQMVVAGQTLAVQLEVLAVTAQGLVAVPASSGGAQGTDLIRFELVSGPPGASVNTFGGQLVYTPALEESGVKVLDIRVSLPPLETTVRVRVSVIPPGCLGLPGAATSCSAGTGGCEGRGFVTCNVTAQTTLCDAVAGLPAPAELGGNNVDDNCNGQVDEGFGNAGQPCAPTGTDRCALAGVFDYSADRTRLECVTALGPPVAAHCDDGMECTADRCDPALGCVVDPAPLGTRCTAASGVCVQTGCVSIMPGMVCDQPQDLLEGTAHDVDLRAAVNSAGLDPACSNAVDWSTGPDVFLRLQIAGGVAYRVVATPDAGVDVRLALHTDGCAGAGACLGSADLPQTGAVETLPIAAAAGARVLVLQVTTPSTPGGHVSVLLQRDALTDDAGVMDGGPLDDGGPATGDGSVGDGGQGGDGGAPDGAVMAADGGTADGGTADGGNADGGMVTPETDAGGEGGGGGGGGGGGRGPCACTGAGGPEDAIAAAWLAAAALTRASRRRRRS